MATISQTELSELRLLSRGKVRDNETYEVGTSPPSYHKQVVRDYLIDLGWNKEPPPPDLPDYVVRNTSRKYLDALERLTSSA